MENEQEDKTPTVDSDVPTSDLPGAAPEGVTIGGQFFAYDNTMEVFRTYQVLIDRCAKDPALLEIEEPTKAAELPNWAWSAVYVAAMTQRSRAGTEFEGLSPAELMRKISLSEGKRMTAESMQFLISMNPNLIGVK